MPAATIDADVEDVEELPRRDVVLTPTAWRVWCALSDQVSVVGVPCWIVTNRQMLADQSECPIRSVSDALRELDEAGLVGFPEQTSPHTYTLEVKRLLT